MTSHITSLDNQYRSGMISLFPEALDDFESIYKATNNAQVPLKHTVMYNSIRVIVDDTSLFPDNGIIRIGQDIGIAGKFEEIYYANKTSNTFENLIRGYAGTQQGTWDTTNFVSNAVFAEHHNALKDAVLNMEANFGSEVLPAATSLNGILTAQEVRFLSPKPLFRAFPISGPPPLTIRLQNFSSGYITRFLWSFGDGGTSLEESPIHTYTNEGNYTVTLNITNSTGGQGIATKNNYIQVNVDYSVPFFYVDSISNPYSQQTANNLHESPKQFLFVDQSDGDIVQRNWVFGDGDSFIQVDPDIHDITHIYRVPGEYIVTELIQFANGSLKKVELPTSLLIL